jgi:hypothetical protein
MLEPRMTEIRVEQNLHDIVYSLDATYPQKIDQRKK